MELLYVDKQETNKQAVTLLLYGEIGTKIDGDLFAREISMLSATHSEIIIKINSTGGSVIQGLSIVSAILGSQAKTTAIVEGIAASMAGVIAMAADRVKMNDFARIMVHNPFAPDKQTLTEKETKTLSNLTDMLNQILSRRGVDKNLMGDFMNSETWFTSGKAMELKMVDEIIINVNFKAAEQFISKVAASQLNSELFNQFILTKKVKMETVINMLGLPTAATEAEVLVKVTELKNEILLLQKANDLLKSEQNKARKAEVLNLVENAIQKGHFATEKKAELIEIGNHNFETLKVILNSIKTVQPLSLSDTLKAAQANAPTTELVKTFDWYRRNDELKLREIKNTQPELFAKLYADWQKENS